MSTTHWDKKDGIEHCKVFFKNGVVKLESFYLNNQLHGKFCERFKDGSVRFEGQYFQGKTYGKVKSRETPNSEFIIKWFIKNKNVTENEYLESLKIYSW